MAGGATADNFMQFASDPRNWKMTRKKDYKVWGCLPGPYLKGYNVLENENWMTTGDKAMVLSGTLGEVWPVDIKKAAKTYTFDSTGEPITPQTLAARQTRRTMINTSTLEDVKGIMEWQQLRTRSDGVVLWALHVPLSVRELPVHTSWGDTLYANSAHAANKVGHGQGDFLICADGGGMPNFNDMWVLNGVVFPKTYDLRAFPGMFSGNQSASEAPKPNMQYGPNISPLETYLGGDTSSVSGGKAAKYMAIAQKVFAPIGGKVFNKHNIAVEVVAPVSGGLVCCMIDWNRQSLAYWVEESPDGKPFDQKPYWLGGTPPENRDVQYSYYDKSPESLKGALTEVLKFAAR